MTLFHGRSLSTSPICLSGHELRQAQLSRQCIWVSSRASLYARPTQHPFLFLPLPPRKSNHSSKKKDSSIAIKTFLNSTTVFTVTYKCSNSYFFVLCLIYVSRPVKSVPVYSYIHQTWVVHHLVLVKQLTESTMPSNYAGNIIFLKVNCWRRGVLEYTLRLWHMVPLNAKIVEIRSCPFIDFGFCILTQILHTKDWLFCSNIDMFQSDRKLLLPHQVLILCQALNFHSLSYYSTACNILQ